MSITPAVALTSPRRRLPLTVLAACLASHASISIFEGPRGCTGLRLRMLEAVRWARQGLFAMTTAEGSAADSETHSAVADGEGHSEPTTSAFEPPAAPPRTQQTPLEPTTRDGGPENEMQRALVPYELRMGLPTVAIAPAFSREFENRTPTSHRVPRGGVLSRE